MRVEGQAVNLNGIARSQYVLPVEAAIGARDIAQDHSAVLPQLHRHESHQGICRVDNAVVVHIRPYLPQNVAVAVVQLNGQVATLGLAAIYVHQMGEIGSALGGGKLVARSPRYRIAFKVPLPGNDFRQRWETKGVGITALMTAGGQGRYVGAREYHHGIALCRAAELIDHPHKVQARVFGVQDRPCFASIP